MLRWKIWTAFGAVFLAGALVGVFGTGVFLKMRFAPPSDRETYRAEMTERLTRTIADGLELTAPQTQGVRAEVAETLIRLDGVHAELRPRAQAIITEGIERVKQALPEAKRPELDELIEQTRKRPFGLFRLPPPPPPPPFP
ncbi:MAG: hypothetical protein AB7E51_10580 [Pseudodesulfovibrio sp.]|jgi:hypothetical protein|uniref:Periplasmic heavy metal sensor n=1 Tax=Pseudodesulfovibrio indicus TaxID=1716143 RepID=A0A126QLI1_9BACT|nr:hypothetical protein [Pseudodesulfovibrio indicus]AMK10761.1 hypothetical protein AWY79_06370 [Pseudodesulfovibrio indicus]TDT91746.1 hypothetical protein EDC59_101145 [Pseudodesulfovibrio indicus]